MPTIFSGLSILFIYHISWDFDYTKFFSFGTWLANLHE